MKFLRSSIPFASASLALASAIFMASCSGSTETTSSDIDISRLDVKESILTAERIYRIISDSDTTYLEKSASLTWPVNIADADISSLQNALLRTCFTPDSAATEATSTPPLQPDPEEALRNFLLDITTITSDDANISHVDSLPAPADGYDQVCYFDNVKASVIELDEQLITYQITASTYLGGAHPLTSVRPLTYDLSNNRLLTLDNLFRPGTCPDSIMPVIVNALARQFDVKPAHLRRAGIFADQPSAPGIPYIYNNTLFFHYNPYDIAPYSMGMIDVAVYPYEVEQYLTPEAADLFDLGF